MWPVSASAMARGVFQSQAHRPSYRNKFWEARAVASSVVPGKDAFLTPIAYKDPERPPSRRINEDRSPRPSSAWTTPYSAPPNPTSQRLRSACGGQSSWVVFLPCFLAERK